MSQEMKIGKIFKTTDTNGKTTFWKITGTAKPSGHGPALYPVIKCNWNGRPFKTTNLFTASFVNQQILRDSFSDEPVDMSGIKIGKMKRRIGFLKHRIAQDQLELEALLNQIEE